MGLFQPTLDARPNQRYYIKCPEGSIAIPPGATFPNDLEDGSKIHPEDGDGVWRWTPDRYFEERKKGNVIFKETNSSPLIDQHRKQSKWNVYTKIWLKDRLEGGSLPLDLFDKFENRHSSKEISELDLPFDFAKPTQLLAYLMQIIDVSGYDIVLDFFAGSCSTAHALLTYNAQNLYSNARFVCVQLPEKIDVDTEAFKAGFVNIAEIGKERIRRVIKKIETEQAERAKENKEKLPGMEADVPELDLGFKVFKLDSSNIKPWDADFDNLEESLFNAVENIKSDRSEADVLYELLLKYGLDLAVSIEKRKIDGKTVYIIGAGALIVCLAKQISLEFVEGIAALKDELKPEVMRVVFKDSGFKDDVVKTNAVQILRQAGIDDVKSL